MSQSLITFLTNLAGQAVQVGLAAFFWQYVQKKLEKIDDVDRRVHRLENRDEMRKDLGLDKPRHE